MKWLTTQSHPLLRKMVGNMAKDIFIEVLKILNQSDGSDSNVELAHDIADMVRDVVDKQIMELLQEFKKGCGGE